jgi:hypothetical protein
MRQGKEPNRMFQSPALLSHALTYSGLALSQSPSCHIIRA